MTAVRMVVAVVDRALPAAALLPFPDGRPPSAAVAVGSCGV